MKILRKIMDGICKVCEVIGVILMAFIVIAILAQVFVRMFGGTIQWPDELSRYAMQLMVLVGSVVIARHSDYIRITSILDRLPPKVKVWFNAFGHVVVLFVSGVLTLSFGYVATTQATVRFSVVSSITIGHFFWVCTAVMFLVTLMTLFYIIEIIAKRDEEPTEQQVLEEAAAAEEEGQR